MVKETERHHSNGRDVTSSSSGDHRPTLNSLSRDLLTGTRDTFLRLPDNAQYFIQNRESRHGSLTYPGARADIDRIIAISGEDSTTLLSTIGKDPTYYTDEQCSLLHLWESQHGPLTEDMINHAAYIQNQLKNDYMAAMNTSVRESSTTESRASRASSRQYYIDELSSTFAKDSYKWTSGEQQVADYWISQGGTIDPDHDTIHTQLDQMEMAAHVGSIEHANRVKWEERMALEAERQTRIADSHSHTSLDDDSGDNSTSMDNAIRNFTQRRFGNYHTEG